MTVLSTVKASEKTLELLSKLHAESEAQEIRYGPFE
jgi:hypothetical protein